MPATNVIAFREIASVRSTRAARSAWMLLASADETSHACMFQFALPGLAPRGRSPERFTSPLPEPLAALNKRAGARVRGTIRRRLRTGGDRDLEEAKSEVRRCRLLGESEEPRRGGKERAVSRVEGEVHRHWNDLEQTKLVIGEQAVAD